MRQLGKGYSGAVTLAKVMNMPPPPWHCAYQKISAKLYKAAETVAYYNLDLSVSLEHCLKGKVVVEYPTFTVVLTEDLSQFNLISPGGTMSSKSHRTPYGI
ncbi:hypothetical protein HPB49_002473 [Dermacentor silvarum]|uniref:Uncharacterized protein n=1 Tax=Dermacentor silvarum TaxID=543639 RepID=A0ACB8DTB0_DERSI|nr:hypothetical protein HPB49_002473 [Dermacentor silvarum]